jgi:hypothetical protein
MKKIQLLFVVINLLAFGLHAQDKIPSSIIQALDAGKSSELSAHFNSTIELVILEEEDVYSRIQAEQILKNFFMEHRPGSFKVIFEGGKENSRYAIGTLTTSGGSFRVYFLLKMQSSKPLIHQLRIEKEDG